MEIAKRVWDFRNPQYVDITAHHCFMGGGRWALSPKGKNIEEPHLSTMGCHTNANKNGAMGANIT